VYLLKWQSAPRANDNMDPFDIIDITDDKEFISTNNGFTITHEQAEEFYEAGIEFTRKARNELMKESSEFFKEL
jgi:hypothetical protein